MNKKSIFIILVTLIIAILAVVFFWFFKGSPEQVREVLVNNFPFGSPNTTTSEPETPLDSNMDGENTPLDPNQTIIPVFDTPTQITTSPVSGFHVNNQNMLYVDRATGHIFEVVFGPNGFTSHKITNTTLPAVQEAIWAENGNSVLLRYTADNNQMIQTYYLKLLRDAEQSVCPSFNRSLQKNMVGEDVRSLQRFLNTLGATPITNSGAGSAGNETTSFGPATETAVKTFQGEQNIPVTGIVDQTTQDKIKTLCPQETSAGLVETSGSFLPNDIKSLVVSPSGTRIFYLTVEGGEGVGTIASPNGQNKEVVFRSPVREWAAVWPQENTVIITTKPTGTLTGFSYSLNLSTGALVKLHEGVGLSVNARGTDTLLGETGNGLLLSRMTSTGTITSLPIATLPEKCAWGSATSTVYCAVPINTSSSVYPDTWYQGRWSFTDTLYVVDNGVVSTQKDISSLDLDIISPSMGNQDRFFFFINKRDLTLWAVPLERR